MRKHRLGWVAGVIACGALTSASGDAAPRAAKTPRVGTLPPVTALLSGSRIYPATSLARTSHAGWVESTANVNFPQEVELVWHVDGGGSARVEGRPAWDSTAPWKELGRWGKGASRPRKGSLRVSIAEPTLLRLRVRAARFPRSGIASLKASYQRRTVAALRGEPGSGKRPVIVAEGYDPFNAQDLNDPSWHRDPAFTDLVAEGRSRYRLDPWLLDWGDGGAPLEQQAEDFAEIARQVRERNGGGRRTVAVGMSMGAVSLRYALASAAGKRDDLGVCRYVSVNGPHRGAWVNPELLQFLLKRAKAARPEEPSEASEAFVIRRGLDNPAARQLLIGAAGHRAFYQGLQALGARGYHPGVPRVAFSNGSLVREGNELADLMEGERGVVHRVSMRPLWLPLWVTLHRTRGEFRYGAFPGELLPESLRVPVREHARFLGVFRFDFRAQWEKVPTFIPTHSALDFPETLTGESERYQYSEWRQSSFPVLYVSANQNLPHDRPDVPWINPRTGKGAPAGEKAILYEIAQAYAKG